MNEYILLMHDDVVDCAKSNDGENWGKYFAALSNTGHFDGGSSIGNGESLKKGQTPSATVSQIGGFIRVRAESLEAAKTFLRDNPVYEGGGTVEVRELPKD
jgi:hypothetical protein